MKRNLTIVLSLWIGWCVLGMEAAYRSGVEVMLAKANEGHGIWSAEYGIGVLRRHGGAVGEVKALKLAVELASAKREGDLLDGLREVLCDGETKVLANLEGAHGGWAVEMGGEPEMWATLLAMECLLELSEPPVACSRGWNWVKNRVVETGEFSCSGRCGNEMRMAGQLLTVAGLARRHGWGMDSKSRQVVQEAVEWIKRQFSADDRSDEIRNYDLALIIRGLCLLGDIGESEALAEKLADRQTMDGGWQDDTVGDDWLVTCAVVEALGGYLAAKKTEGGVSVEWMEGNDGKIGRLGAYEYGEFALRGLDDGTVVTLEVLKAGEIIDYRYIGKLEEDKVSWFTGTRPPGDYELHVVFWDDEGLSWLGEASLNFEIMEDSRCRNVSWTEPLRDKVLHGGDDWCSNWTMSWDYDGNVSEVAKLSWQLSLDGAVFEEGEKMVELSPSVRHGHVILTAGPHVAPVDAGEYELEGQLTTASGEFTCRRRLTVVGGAVYEVENDVFPKQISLGASRLRHTLNIRCLEGEELLATGGFTVLTEERRIIDEVGEKLIVELADIHGVDGRLMSSGWLAVQSFYGKCIGEMELGGSRPEGFLCGVRVMDGCAMMTIDAEGKGRFGAASVVVYQFQPDEMVIGEKLGQFDIHWMER